MSRAPTAASPVSAAEAAALLAPYASAPALLLAVSGGPDSVALMVLAARWRMARRKGPDLTAVTIDHGLRRESAAEARRVKKLATALGVAHVTRQWRGEKPDTGIPAAARAARYRLLAAAARKADAGHVLTAHTLDDQAETVLMRLVRGSGLSGLGAMQTETTRDNIVLGRPLLGIAKARLIATLHHAGIAYADDPTNTDGRFLRPRLRAALPALAAEGLDASSLAKLARRLQRADAALESATDAAARRFGDGDDWPVADFAELPAELRIRLLRRALARHGHEGVADLAQIEALDDALQAAPAAGLRRTLAGALVTLRRGRLALTPAPLRRGRTPPP